ncbi:Putative L-aspartate dehydrogenase [Strongyloides ratti]|uniref:Aspartate dehydrogenase domain-containing protein n=1 Tax=Strongyloides ratti TaxID=34506 RepID=A0A090MYD4_STRRB|nr:Putative L-aspartate dehydrogenase [Strongyloides ratti]CEF66989.1 Putative L-aspartate dehydrogenase [Strongyloides ratti]
MKIGIIGFGHLGQFLKNQLDEDNDYEVIKIWNRTPDVDNNILPLNDITKDNLKDIDLVVEVAHPDITKMYAKIILSECNLFIGSPTALSDQETYNLVEDLGKKYNRSIFVPTGALWAAEDIMKMAELGQLKKLSISMIKHPSSFKVFGDLKKLCDEAMETSTLKVLYSGPVRHLCKLAPNNVNTMAGAAIAAKNLGFDNVEANLIADPEMLEWHIVELDVTGEDGFNVKIRRKNPAKPGAVTGNATYFSFLASIHRCKYKPSGIHIC